VPRTITETADPNQLQIRARVMEPDGESTLIERAHVEVLVVYTRSDSPDRPRGQSVIFQIADTGPSGGFSAAADPARTLPLKPRPGTDFPRLLPRGAEGAGRLPAPAGGVRPGRRALPPLRTGCAPERPRRPLAEPRPRLPTLSPGSTSGVPAARTERAVPALWTIEAFARTQPGRQRGALGAGMS